MLRRTRRKNGQEGQALVETTLMILAVLLLLMGIIEFGFLFYAYVRVSNATREGVRAGSLWLMHPKYPTLCDQVKGGVWSEFPAIIDDPESGAVTITLKDGDVDCSVSPAPEAGEPITVTATYKYPLPMVSALPIIRDVIPSPFPVARTVVMRFQ